LASRENAADSRYDKVHGDIAERMNSAGGYRRTLIRYGALNN